MRPDQLRREMFEQNERAKAERQLEVSKMIERARRRAVLDHAHLVGDPIWDRYLTQVEEIQALDRDELTDLEAKERSETYETPEEGARRRHRSAILRAKIDARDQVISLPKKLADEHGKKTE